MNIGNLMTESAQNFKDAQADAAKLAQKWEKSGLLKNLDGKIEKNNVSVMLENTLKQVIKEQSSTGGTASFQGGTGEQWAGVALPLVRKVFAQIAAKDFVSVQPMNMPSGLVFFLDFKYGTETDGRKSGDNMYGNVSTAQDKIDVDEEVSGGLYGAGRFGYSINEFSSSISTLATGSANSASIAYEDGLKPSDFVTVAVSESDLEELDTKGVRAFRLVSGSEDLTDYPELTRYVNGNIEFVVNKSDITGTSLSNATVYYHKQPDDNTRGDFEDNPEDSIEIPEINVQLSSEEIVAKTRKLKAQWTPEFAQDLNAYHSVDAEAELTSLLSEHISMEIDLELLDMLIQDARTTERWSARSNKIWDNGQWTSTTAGGDGYYNTQGQWFQTLGTKMQKVSNKIHQKTLRGGANFAVVSPSVSTILESIPGYAANTDGDKMDFAMGVEKVGTLNSRYKVYKNPYMTENTMLLGYRGSQFLETGAVYAPYIPLMMTPLVYNPDTFTPRKGILTRYAKKMVRPEFYGKVFISDLETV